MRLIYTLLYLLFINTTVFAEFNTSLSFETGLRLYHIKGSIHSDSTQTYLNQQLQLDIKNLTLSYNNLLLHYLRGSLDCDWNERYFTHLHLETGQWLDGNVQLCTSGTLALPQLFPGKFWSDDSSFKGSIQGFEGGSFETQVQIGSHFYPQKKIRLSPFISVTYSQYKLPFPIEAQQYASTIIKQYPEFKPQLSKTTMTVPWICPEIGLATQYTLSRYTLLCCEVALRSARFPQTWFGKKITNPIHSSGIRGKLGLTKMINENWEMGVYSEHERSKIRLSEKNYQGSFKRKSHHFGFVLKHSF